MADADETSWKDRVQARLDHLQNLERGWSGYLSEPVSALTADLVQEFLGHLEGLLDMDQVQLVPSEAGGIQLEWHAPGGTVELFFEIDRPDWPGFKRYRT